MKTAIITGVLGQDGAYLAKLLLEAGYRVVGTSRNPGNESGFWRLDELGIRDQVALVSSLCDPVEIVREHNPDEIYNLMGESSVAASFLNPFETIKSNGLNCLNWLETIRQSEPDIKYYQASSSEIFGSYNTFSKDESTGFHPKSPYAVSKLFAHCTTVNYREAYDLFSCCGILFNHESMLRGSQFVTSKIVRGAVSIKNGSLDCLQLGNLDAQRDWGHASDYVDGMYKMMQCPQADDYVFATGILHSVRDFVVKAFEMVGIDLLWEGSGLDETGICSRSGKTLIRVNPEYYRPSDLSVSLGNSLKAINKLGWKSRITFDMIIEEMVAFELRKS